MRQCESPHTAISLRASAGDCAPRMAAPISDRLRFPIERPTSEAHNTHARRTDGTRQQRDSPLLGGPMSPPRLRKPKRVFRNTRRAANHHPVEIASHCGRKEQQQRDADNPIDSHQRTACCEGERQSTRARATLAARIEQHPDCTHAIDGRAQLRIDANNHNGQLSGET